MRRLSGRADFSAGIFFGSNNATRADRSAASTVAFLLSVSTNVLAAAARQSVRILLWQTLWIGVLAAILAVTLGTKIAVSALVGGGIGLVWTVYMALALFKHSLTHGAQMSALSFFAGWLFKVVVTVSLLVIALRSRVFAPLWLLVGLFGAMVAYWAWFVFGKKYASDADGK
jgi:F0F1-type ATP synthase assembly protein I